MTRNLAPYRIRIVRGPYGWAVVRESLDTGDRLTLALGHSVRMARVNAQIGRRHGHMMVRYS